MKLVKLSDISNKITKGTTPQKEAFQGKEVNYIKSESLNYNGHIDINYFCSIDMATHKSKLKRSILKENDILISIAGANLGKIGIVSKDMLPANTNQAVGIISLKPNLVKSRYVYYYMQQTRIRNIINNSVAQSAQPNLNLTQLGNIKIEIPQLNIQDKIIKILDIISKKIDLNIRTNNNLYEIGRAYFENYLESCKEEIRIKEVANEILDYHKSKEKKVKLINSSDITENNFPEFEFVDNCNLKGHFKKRFRKYDILYSQIRPRNHHFGYVLFENTEEYIASTRLMVVRAKEEKISSSLLYYYLTSKEAIEDFTTKTETRSGTFPQGNYGDLSSLKIKYNKNQENITNVLNIVLNRIYSNQIKTKNLEKIRDTLLPKLMNGEIDIDKIEI